MNGSLAQIVALTCHLNGRIRGMKTGPFFPNNSTCQFCEYVRFEHQKRGWFGRSKEWLVVAQTPDEWLAQQTKAQRALLLHGAGNHQQFSDRMTAGFVGGGGNWLLAVRRSFGVADCWQAKWEADTRQPPEKRWRVGYGLIAENLWGTLPKVRTLEAITTDLHKALNDISAFAAENDLDHFNKNFTNALACLATDDPFSLVYHKDLAPEGVLSLPAKQILAACQASWVFGGMGSWNDMGFDGEMQTRYEKVSDTLFNLVNEGIEVAANSSSR